MLFPLGSQSWLDASLGLLVTILSSNVQSLPEDENNSEESKTKKDRSWMTTSYTWLQLYLKCSLSTLKRLLLGITTFLFLLKPLYAAGVWSITTSLQAFGFALMYGSSMGLASSPHSPLNHSSIQSQAPLGGFIL